MRLIKFLLVAGITLALLVIFNQNKPFGSALPPLGKLLNPFTGFWQNAESSPAPERLQIPTAGLDGPIEVIFDQRLVPHIFAESNRDAAYAQGYVHAIYRLWQMDISTRAVGGRLSEVLGAVTLERDRLQKRKGIVWAAENSLAAWMESPEETALVQAYADGINAYIDQLDPGNYPLEYKLLDYKPEPWTPLKSALFLKYMSESLCSRHSDVPATNTLKLLGKERFDFLFPEVNPRQSPIIPESKAWVFDPLEPNPDTSKSELLGDFIRHQLFDLPSEFIGSNNWAVAPAKTAEGNPILCSDPHLDLTLPSIWFETHFHTPELNSYGVSLPSVPGLLIGFNDDIAWAETNVGHDVMDWYTIKWVDDSKTKYWFDDQQLETELRYDTIYVRGQEPVVEAVKYTVWGPVVYENPRSPYQDMAMRWIAHDRPSKKAFYDIGTFWRLMKAKNYEEYRQALIGFESPAQNFAFASRDGDVAITVSGKLPLKRKEQGRFVQDGSRSINEWSGFIPFEQNPYIRNPERGFVSSSNQHSTGEDYPYYYNSEGFDSYRGRLVNRLLDSMQQITVQDMMRMQNNSFSLHGKELTEALLATINKSELNAKEQQALAVLESWDYYYKEGSRAPVLLDIIEDSLYRLAFDELFAVRDSISIMVPKSWRLISLLQEAQSDPIFDRKTTPEVEDAKVIATLAFKQAVPVWEASTKDWGHYNGAYIGHMGRVPGLGAGNIYMSGYGDAINAIRKDHGPSWRMIVELGDQVEAYGVYPGGQSGNPGSKYYDQMIASWAKGDYYPLIFPSRRADFNPKDVLFKLDFQ